MYLGTVRRTAFNALLLPCLSAFAAQAQSTKPVDGSLLRAGTDSFIVTIGGSVIGRATQTLVATTEGGVRVWRQDYQFESPDGDRSTDTLVMDAKSLRPIREARASSMGRFAFTFRANELEAVSVIGGAAPSTQRFPITGPVFSSAALDGVVRALPLKEGMVATAEFYYPPPAGVQQLSTRIRVVRSASIPGPGGASRAAWVVTTGEPGSATTFWIDKGDRTILQFDTEEDSTVIQFRRTGP